MKQKTAQMIIEAIDAPNTVMRLKGRPSLHILISIANNEGEIPLKELYSLQHWTNKTLRQHILYLENDEMIEVLDDTNDRRSKVARLTEKSFRQLADYEAKIFEILRKYA
jgi:DNA-binding MarR family transcriptional regulator